MNPLTRLLEAALFASARPVTLDDLQAITDETGSSIDEVKAALEELRAQYDENGHGIEVIEVAGGFQILSRPEYTETIERAQLAARPQRLSAAALETLAIIAYRQPIGRAEIEEIRGVNCGHLLKSLHERELIEVVARGEGMGRPLLYGTTPAFLEQFALRHLSELPRADELAVALRQPGERVVPLSAPVVDRNVDNEENGNAPATDATNNGERRAAEDSPTTTSVQNPADTEHATVEAGATG